MNLTILKKDLTGNLHNYHETASDVCVWIKERTVECSADEVLGLIG